MEPKMIPGRTHRMNLRNDLGRVISSRLRYPGSRTILPGTSALLAALAVALPAARGADAPGASGDWPMLGHDPTRSGATAVEVRPPFERKWYRLFPDEGLMAGVQPIISGGTVYVGTLAGVLHAIDAESGKDAWTYRAGGPILHAAAAGEGKVFLGAADGKVHAVRAETGEAAWTFATGAAVWNAPLVHEGVVVAGSRDGRLHALDASSGALRWAADLGAPILSSPALDAKAGRVVAATEDMRVHAVGFGDGKLLWTSAKLPGVSFRGYHPVVAPDGSVLIASQPGISLDDFQTVLLDMVKEVFGDFASWRHRKEENEKLRRENFALLEKEGTYEREMEYLRKRLEDEPAYQTFFALDPASGRQRFVAPIVYSESMNGPGAPAIVTPDGRVLVKFQALLRSRYQHYSPFLNAGWLDTRTGRIAPALDETRTYGWHDSLLLVHDEQCQLTVGGRVLLNAHQDNVNALDLGTREGYPFPLARGIHEPAPGEALAIQARLLRGRELPAGKEWLARGTAVHGGGSVIDAAVSIAGDSFYYIPTHELNAGAAVIAYRMRGREVGAAPAPAGAPEAKLERAELTAEEWARVQALPWDWDTLRISRLRHLLESLPGKVPGTRDAPLEEDAARAVAGLTDAEIDRFIREAPVLATPAGEEWAPLRAKLAGAVKEVVSGEWRPLLFPAGKHPGEAYRFFTDPSETLLALALAYPHLDEDLRREVRSRAAAFLAPGGPLSGEGGRRTYAPGAGAVRSAYEPPPERLVRIAEPPARGDLARLYPIWLWAHVSGDWAPVEALWPRRRGAVDEAPGPFEIDCGNGRAGGLIAYARIARRLGDREALDRGLAAARKALRERLAFEIAHPRGGVIFQVPVLRSAFSRWHGLTPEVGRLVAERAGKAARGLVDLYVDRHRPTWWLAWNVETLMRNECPLELPTTSLDIFQARAWILGEPAAKLAGFVDIPWCRADEYHVEKIAMVLAAAAGTRWVEAD
jgi:hypothetical protein